MILMLNLPSPARYVLWKASSDCSSMQRSRSLHDLAMRGLTLLLMAAMFLLGMALSTAQTAPNMPATDASVKAAYLYKFIGYAELPPASTGTAGAPFVIGVVGANDIAAELARITIGRMINGRPIEVRTLRDTDSLADLQVLFIGLTDSTRLSRLLWAARQRSILSVTDADDALELGSIINFRSVEDRVRFEVSLINAERSGIKLSSRMVAVASRAMLTSHQFSQKYPGLAGPKQILRI
jgi:hypothetical protein